MTLATPVTEQQRTELTNLVADFFDKLNEYEQPNGKRDPIRRNELREICKQLTQLERRIDIDVYGFSVIPEAQPEEEEDNNDDYSDESIEEEDYEPDVYFEEEDKKDYSDEPPYVRIEEDEAELADDEEDDI